MIDGIVRGGVYWARLPEAGERPVVVLSWDGVNNALRSPIVCEITTTSRTRSFPTCVRLSAGEGGLHQDSYAVCHQLVTIRAEQLKHELGFLSDDRMAEIERALAVALDLGGARP